MVATRTELTMDLEGVQIIERCQRPQDVVGTFSAGQSGIIALAAMPCRRCSGMLCARYPGGAEGTVDHVNGLHQSGTMVHDNFYFFPAWNDCCATACG